MAVRPALRIARRGSVASWGRSLLVIALVAAPVAALSGAAVLLPSRVSTLDERVANTLGRAQAKLTVVATPADGVRQGVEGGYAYLMQDGGSGDHDPERIDPRTVLPAGTRVLPIAQGAATFETEGGRGSIAVQAGPSWDPVLRGGPYALLSGRTPSAADEVLVSPAAAERLGTTVGGTVRTVAPQARVLRVVGLQRDRSLPATAETVFGSSGLLPSVTPDSVAYYVPSTPIDWASVQRLNRAGTTVLSRAVVADPPALGPDLRFEGSEPPFATIAIVAMALVFAALEVALLAGAAFAVGARLQQRTLAIVASVGGDRRVLRGVVTANGLVLGLAGGVVGTAIGIAGALVLIRLTDDGAWTSYPGLHLIWPLLAGIVVFGAVVGWLSALVPARAAAKVDVVGALRGARTPPRPGRRTPVVGLVLLIGGIGLSLLGGVALLAALQRTDGGTQANALAQIGALALLGGGPVLAQIGVVLCSGLLLRTIARALARAPLPARLAARDMSRNLGRAVPAVAVIMSTVFVASFAMCAANAASIDAATHRSWSAARIGQAVSYIPAEGRATRKEAARALAVLRQDLPVARTTLLESTPLGVDDETPSSRKRDAMPQVRFPQPLASCGSRARGDERDLRCGPFTANGGGGINAQQSVTVGSPEALAALLGRAPSPASLDALRRGGAVALRSDLAPGGTASFDWFTPKQLSEDPSSARPVRVTRLPAVVDLPAHPLEWSVFVSPSTAAALHLKAVPDRVLLDFTRPPTATEQDRAAASLGALVNQPDGWSVQIETGPQDYGGPIAWYLVLACLVVAIAAGATAIGLARVDARADDTTFAALGAPPRIRRGVAAVQALLVCGVGAVVGALLGLLPAVAIGQATQSFAFAPPVLQLALTAVGVPVLIALGSALLLGRRVDVARRPAMA